MAKDIQKKKKEIAQDEEFSPQVEKTFKITVRLMSWFLGVVFILVLVLPEFNSPVLDKITRWIFITAIIDLMVVLLIEFFADHVKTFLTRILNEKSS